MSKDVSLENSTSVAYLLGELFAILEKIDQKAYGNKNQYSRKLRSLCLNPYLISRLIINSFDALVNFNANDYEYWNGMIREQMCRFKAEDFLYLKNLRLIQNGDIFIGYYKKSAKLSY